MKLSFKVKINKPVDEVWKVLNDPDVAVKFYPRIHRIQVTNGLWGEEGSTAEYLTMFAKKYITEKFLEVKKCKYIHSQFINGYMIQDTYCSFITVDDKTIMKLNYNIKFKSYGHFIPLKWLQFVLVLQIVRYRLKRIIEKSKAVETEPFTSYINPKAQGNPLQIFKEPLFIYILFVIFLISFLVGKMMVE